MLTTPYETLSFDFVLRHCCVDQIFYERRTPIVCWNFNISDELVIPVAIFIDRRAKQVVYENAGRDLFS
jgi:hypothetical protein